MIAHRVELAIACLLGTAGCSNQTVLEPMSALSPKNLAANAPILARFVKQQCFDRPENGGEFASSLRATGWSFENIQKIDPKNPLSVEIWSTSDVEVARGEPVTGAVDICTVLVQRAVTPPTGVMNAALSQVVGIPRGADGEWWWKRWPARKLHMLVNEKGTDQIGIGITVEKYRLPWWQGLLG